MKKKYCKQITLGYDSSGKRIQKRVYGNSKFELDKNIYAIRKEMEACSNPSLITFGDYADKWYETYKSNKEAKTQEYYLSALAKLTKINSVPLKQISKMELQSIINENYEHPRTCVKIRQVCKAVFESALEDGIIARNPANGLQVPKYKATEKRALTEKELDAIRSVKLDPMGNAAVKMMYYFGLRPEELRGLQKDDFDFKEHILTIQRTTVFASNSPTIKGTKTGVVRCIPIPDEIEKEIKGYINALDKDWLFTMRSGEPMTKSAWRIFSNKVFDAIKEQLGCDTDMTWYTFRHNAGTRLYYISDSKLSNKMKAQLMGHSEKIFLEIYSHLDEDNEDLSVLRQITL